MYAFKRQVLQPNQVIKYSLVKDDSPASFTDFLNGLASESSLRTVFIELLSGVPFNAFHWETPALNESNDDQEFDFVVTHTPSIDLPPNNRAFQSYFTGDQSIVEFSNLGGDAHLIVPAPPENDHNYSHIGTFTREAPLDQQHALWSTVGRVTLNRLSTDPLWLNTAGGGVPWLHIRLDSRPKYYRHQPYMKL